MKQKASLFVGLIAIGLLFFFFMKKPIPTPKHLKLDGTQAILENKAPRANLKNYQVNFYMENSASMDGYVNGNTGFKDVLGKMIVSSHHCCKGTDFFLTSSSCHPKVFVKEFCYFLMSCHQHCLGVNLLVQR